MPDHRSDDEQDLIDLAYPFALDAVSDTERATITGRLDAASAATAEEFARIVSGVHETMARVTSRDADAPPPELRGRLLRAIEAAPAPAGAPRDDLADRRARRRRRLGRAVAAAAAVVVVGVGAGIAVRQLEHTPSAPTVEQVLADPDARTVTTDVAGGTITLSSSARSDAVVVSMSNVPPPPAGHVYQMWFLSAAGEPRSAGTMSADTMPPPGGEVVPDLDTAISLAVTVEPGSGSALPTGNPIVVVTLT
ncbi:anti-sigma factor [Prescottella subtropica]|uniref:anti-sigma factor n=1 Tax=Prescottella subtropica TaxID=2545757 RepID=UPI0010F71C00|nr:anti-sigma factor [Prescottella subtropica]